MNKITSIGKRGLEARRQNIDARTRLPQKAGREVKKKGISLFSKRSVRFGYSTESGRKELRNKKRRVGCAENDLQVMEDPS